MIGKIDNVTYSANVFPDPVIPNKHQPTDEQWRDAALYVGNIHHFRLVGLYVDRESRWPMGSTVYPLGLQTYKVILEHAGESREVVVEVSITIFTSIKKEI